MLCHSQMVSFYSQLGKQNEQILQPQTQASSKAKSRNKICQTPTSHIKTNKSVSNSKPVTQQLPQSPCRTNSPGHWPPSCIERRLIWPRLWPCHNVPFCLPLISLSSPSRHPDNHHHPPPQNLWLTLLHRTKPAVSIAELLHKHLPSVGKNHMTTFKTFEKHFWS